MPQYLKVEDQARPGFSEPFYRNVLADVVPALIDRGALQGRTLRGKRQVLDDDALRRVLQLRIEPLVYGQQGWSFAAVDAPADDVLRVARDVLEVAEVRRDVKVSPMRVARGEPAADGVRPLYLVKPKASNWPVLVVRAHWFMSEDWNVAQMLAREASKRLKARAVAAANHDTSGTLAEEWRSGKLAGEWTDETDGFYVKFYELGIAAPSC